MNALAAAVAKVDIDHYVRQPDGRPIPQSSAPAIIEALIHLADIQPGHRILEIGTGSGYSTALLATIVGESGAVTSVEVNPVVAARAKGKLAKTTNAAVVHGDGGDGAFETAPFHRVIAWTTPRLLPKNWVQQTVDGGRIVTAVKVARVAAANLAVAVDISGHEPIAGAFHDGSFVDMAPPPADFRFPYYYLDAHALIDDQPVWLSAPAVRNNPSASEALLAELIEAEPQPSPIQEYNWSDLMGYLAATAPDNLATVQLQQGRGIGYITNDSAAVLLKHTLKTSRDSTSRQRLEQQTAEWKSHGRPALDTLFPRFEAVAEGWTVKPTR